MKNLGIKTAGLLAIASTHVVLAQEHVHGQGQLQIAQEGSHWHVHLSLPAADALGFEHEAETKAQKSKVKKIAHRLARNQDVLSLNGDCRLVSSEHSLENTQDHSEDNAHKHHHAHKHDEGHGHDKEHDKHDSDHDNHHEEHNDVEVEYRFTCDSPVSEIALGVFESMPSLSAVKLEWITESGQGSSELTKAKPTASL
ncbi:ZrgA family zinc uptake protein [Agaribacter flavus]|uniref:DUF2796 domain-containing protein n=1 Tax=Agaribacter flavus TaxID=1902781 RepID=A0ABV7FLQ7_9ALTE